MNPMHPFAREDRAVLVALAASAALHAALVAGVPGELAPVPEGEAAVYSATLEPASAAEASLAPAPKPAAPRPRARPKPKPPRPEETVAILPGLLDDSPLPEEGPEPVLLAADEGPAPEEPKAEEKPEVVALAEPAAPVPALEPPKFPAGALPERLSIDYQLTSPLADGRAVYTWSRDGDRYEITGEMEAVGFFTIFLEGQITQETRGIVTSEGLRPERFVEHRPQGPAEGLAFDWEKRRVTFDRRGETKEDALAENTVDWLSMIFQLAHVPPQGEGSEMRVYTQRRMYTFTLKVLGLEEIELPIGRVPALHLRHEGKGEHEQVDVWLGVEQHYLPVKLSYPVARNRFRVEQLATDISVR